jgi:hypothetical protein
VFLPHSGFDASPWHGQSDKVRYAQRAAFSPQFIVLKNIIAHTSQSCFLRKALLAKNAHVFTPVYFAPPAMASQLHSQARGLDFALRTSIISLNNLITTSVNQFVWFKKCIIK